MKKFWKILITTIFLLMFCGFLVRFFQTANEFAKTEREMGLERMYALAKVANGSKVGDKYIADAVRWAAWNPGVPEAQILLDFERVSKITPEVEASNQRVSQCLFVCYVSAYAGKNFDEVSADLAIRVFAKGPCPPQGLGEERWFNESDRFYARAFRAVLFGRI